MRPDPAYRSQLLNDDKIRAVTCPTCSAAPGVACVDNGNRNHQARVRVARARAAAERQR